MNTRVCGVNGCEAIYTAQDPHCPVCREPNPIWEAREKARLLDENMGDEAAWTGAPSA